MFAGLQYKHYDDSYYKIIAPLFKAIEYGKTQNTQGFDHQEGFPLNSVNEDEVTPLVFTVLQD